MEPDESKSPYFFGLNNSSNINKLSFLISIILLINSEGVLLDGITFTL